MTAGDASANAPRRLDLTALRGACALALWLVATAALWLTGFGAKENCSAEVGSIERAGTDVLLVPCDLMGWMLAIGAVVGVLIWASATACGAWGRWSTTILTTLAMVGSPVGGLVALSATNLS